MPTLPLSPIVAIQYNLSPPAAARRGFNLGLIIGTSGIINITTRVQVFSSITDIIGAGFTNSSPEYLAAQAYFSATSQPTQVAIGRQGTGETPLQALQACRSANSDWYCVVALAATNSDHTAIAAYMESLNSPYSMYLIQSGDAAVLNNTGGNIAATLKASLYSRTFGLYSTSANEICNVMGYAMGQTTDFAFSAYTLKFKQLPGNIAENLTTQQVLNIQGNNFSCYVNRGSYYNILEQGIMANGFYFDEMIYRDKWVNEIQLSVMDVLYAAPKIPLTEGGVSRIKKAISNACDKLVRLGFLAPGVWNGGPYLTTQNGDYLDNGYVVLSDSVNNMAQSDRDARKSPPIYVLGKEAGAIHSVAIQVNVNR